MLYAAVGDHRLARDAFEALAADDFADLPRGEAWLLNLSLLAETCVALGDERRAGVLHELVLPHAELIAIGPPDTCADAAARPLGLLAATLGDPDEAIRHFERAMELNERMGARPSLAHAQTDCARTLLRRARPGDDERAADAARGR